MAISLGNAFGDFSIGTLGFALLIFFVALIVVGLIGGGIWFWVQKKRLKYTIPLFKKIGNRVVRIGTYKAMDFKLGMAGDKLWYVPKAKKYIPCATLQTAPNEYSHFEREDGEWINIDFPDIDEDMRKAGVKYLQQDMRSQRIAISNILEQRFANRQSWWDKYGNLVTYTIFYLVVAIAMVVIFYQWSGIAEKIGLLFDRIVAYENMKCPASQGVVPAFVMLFMRRRDGNNKFF